MKNTTNNTNNNEMTKKKITLAKQTAQRIAKEHELNIPQRSQTIPL